MDRAYTLSVTDIPHGSGQVLGVFATRDRAEAYMRHVDVPRQRKARNAHEPPRPHPQGYEGEFVTGGLVYRVEAWAVDADPAEYLPVVSAAPR